MLKDILDRVFGDPEETHVDEATSVEVATAVLLVEVAHADHDFSEQDRQVVRTELEKAFNLSKHQSLDVLNEAIDLHRHHISFHEIVRLLKDKVVPESRIVLLRALWRVALSDRVVHRYEESQIRKIADWLYVPHRDFIRAKLEVQQEEA